MLGEGQASVARQGAAGQREGSLGWGCWARQAAGQAASYARRAEQRRATVGRGLRRLSLHPHTAKQPPDGTHWHTRRHIHIHTLQHPTSINASPRAETARHKLPAPRHGQPINSRRRQRLASSAGHHRQGYTYIHAPTDTHGGPQTHGDIQQHRRQAPHTQPALAGPAPAQQERRSQGVARTAQGRERLGKARWTGGEGTRAAG